MSPNLALKLKNIQDHPHAKLLFIWSALDLFLLSSGVITVIASICFHRPKQLIINLIFDDLHYIGMSRSLFFLFLFDSKRGLDLEERADGKEARSELGRR